MEGPSKSEEILVLRFGSLTSGSDWNSMKLCGWGQIPTNIWLGTGSHWIFPLDAILATRQIWCLSAIFPMFQHNSCRYCQQLTHLEVRRANAGNSSIFLSLVPSAPTKNDNRSSSKDRPDIQLGEPRAAFIGTLNRSRIS